MIQRKIKKAIMNVNPGITSELVGLERGRGEVWVKRSLVAKVDKDGEWEILDTIQKYDIDLIRLREAVLAALAQS